jgi:hypothetical protein
MADKNYATDRDGNELFGRNYGPIGDEDAYRFPNEPLYDWRGQAYDGPVYDGSGRLIRGGQGSSYDFQGRGGGSGALEALFALALVLVFVAVIGLVIAVLVKLLEALVAGYNDLTQRYPRAILTVKLMLLTGSVGLLLYLAGFALNVQVAGMLLVPGLWAWGWLTRHLPLVFKPVNALLMGAALWLLAELTTESWMPTWSQLTAGIPFLGHLSFVLLAMPLLFLVWREGNRRWPRPAVPFNRLITGALLLFLFMRVWTEWQPYWNTWTAPLPLAIPKEWLLLLLPLGLWLWRLGQVRWPLPFTAINLLLLGGAMGLLGYHTEVHWIDRWHHWLAGLPLATMPILVIALAPVTIWSWSQLCQRWQRFFRVPNLLLTGTFLWLVLDRTRPLWSDGWRRVWGDVPLAFDLAQAVFVLPFLLWAWSESKRRWPEQLVYGRLLLLSGGLWWIAARTNPLWQAQWHDFASWIAPDLTLVALASPVLIWTWAQLRRKHALVGNLIAAGALSFFLYWLATNVWPDSTLALRTSAALLPWTYWGWRILLRRRFIFGCILALLPLVTLSFLFVLAPNKLCEWLNLLFIWMATQGLPLGLLGYC